MSASPEKRALRDELVRRLAADLESLEQAQRGAVEAATHEEARPENDKDTRALEASYLARGQALRIEELRVGLGEVQAFVLRSFDDDAPIALGAWVTVTDDDDDASEVFLAPHGGGMRLEGERVGVVTPRSPLGRALLGKRAGDDAEVVVDGKRRSLSIVEVR
jgi:transcription elongation GreA/GreB family factor